jgi:hypothetical protein
MEELISLVSRQTGLSDDMAEKGVEMVAGFLQGQLPSAVRSETCWAQKLAALRKRRRALEIWSS